jgi:hypothetical protein
MIGATYGLPIALPQLHSARWHWFGSIWFVYGEPLSLLPGIVLAALLAPLVAYRRRDALMLLVPFQGIYLAWIIGSRGGQLPHRDWPARTGAGEPPTRWERWQSRDRRGWWWLGAASWRRAGRRRRLRLRRPGMRRGSRW